MTNIIKKVRTIGKAFIEPLPVDEKWFQDRMDICMGCEFNSRNIDPEDRSAMSQLKITTKICPEGDHCTACGCCTHRKASQKVEQCGLVDKGQEPKWIALEIASKLDKRITVTNLTPDEGTLVSTNEGLMFDIGETDKGRIDFAIRMHRKGGLDIKSTAVGCTCTIGETVKIDTSTTEFNLTISTTSFTKGRANTRTFNIEYYTSTKRVEKITLIIEVKLK